MEATMVKKLTRHGNSSALVIDRPILELLNIDESTPLQITTDGRRLIIEPADGEHQRKRFEKAMKKSHQRFAKAFKKLAE
jgi:antitoxin MazE